MKMLRPNQNQTNFFSILYDRIPKDHLLKRIANAVDFSFINELVADSYCASFGRPAKEPELMAKLCILERLYNLSDVKVIEEANCNLAYLWFLGLNPDDPLPDPSLLAKFRTQRLKDISLDEILSEIVRQCVEKGIIKGTTLSIDTTHTEANCKKQVPERVMKHLADKVFAALEADHDGKLPKGIDTNIPDYKKIEDHKEAKRVMKEYLEKTVEAVEPFAGFITKEVIQEIKEILSDEKFILQKGLRSLADPDARVGYKSKMDSFFGYKTEYTMVTDERIITAVDVHSGEYVDKDKKTKKKYGKPYRLLVYTFDKEGCKNCPHREECMGRASGGKRFEISENTPGYYQESQRQKQPEFLEKYKKRAAEEWKNAEMKRFHGLARARGWGLRSMSFQAKFTAIAVNLKRIANLIMEKGWENAGSNALLSLLFSNLWEFCSLKLAS